MHSSPWRPGIPRGTISIAGPSNVMLRLDQARTTLRELYPRPCEFLLLVDPCNAGLLAFRGLP